MPPIPDDDPLPDPKTLGPLLDEYLAEVERRDFLAGRHRELVESGSLLARAIADRVGGDVVILHRGFALVPYAEGPAGVRSGYDRMVCLDLDSLPTPPAKPTIEIYRVPPEVADDDQAGAMDPSRVLDPRD